MHLPWLWSMLYKGRITNLQRAAPDRGQTHQRRREKVTYRPISLSSVFYKKASGAITRRLQQGEEHQLCHDQPPEPDGKREQKEISCLIQSIDFKKAFVDTKFIDSCLELLILSCDFHRRVNLFIKNCETWTPQGATSVSSETHGQLEDWINNVLDGLIKRLSVNRGQQPRCAIEWRVTLWHLCTTSSVYRTAPASN